MWFSGSSYLSWLKDEEPDRLLLFILLQEFCCGHGGGCEGADILGRKMGMFFCIDAAADVPRITLGCV